MSKRFKYGYFIYTVLEILPPTSIQASRLR